MSPNRDTETRKATRLGSGDFTHVSSVRVQCHVQLSRTRMRASHAPPASKGKRRGGIQHANASDALHGPRGRNHEGMIRAYPLTEPPGRVKDTTLAYDTGSRHTGHKTDRNNVARF